MPRRDDMWRDTAPGCIIKNRGSSCGRTTFRLVIAVAALAAVSTSPAQSQDPVEQFFRGKTINIYVGSSAGGGYDTYGGRSGATWANKSPANRPSWRRTCRAQAATRRGLHLQGRAEGRHRHRRDVSGGILQPLLGDPPSSTIPRSSSSRQRQQRRLPLLLRTDSPVKCFRDACRREFILGASNEGGTTRDMPAMKNNSRREIPHRHRLCRQARRSRLRSSARRSTGRAASARPIPHGLSAMVRDKVVTIMVQVPSRDTPRSTRRACRGPSISRKPRKTGRRWNWSQPGGIRPALRAAGRRAA